jgi:hypothetical protein
MRWALEQTAIRERSLLYLDLIEHAARVPSFRPLAGEAREILDGHYEEVVRDGVARAGSGSKTRRRPAAAVRALIEGTLLSWLQRDDWRAAHAAYKACCHQGLRTLLGAG